MKTMLAVVVISLSCACASKKSANILPMAENYLKGRMKDPSSFQVIKSSIVDTTMMSQWLKESYDEDTAMISKKIARNKLNVDMQNFEANEAKEKAEYEKIFEPGVNFYRITANNKLKRLKALKHDSIFFITVSIEFRAKNSYGALDVDSKMIKYYPSDTTFKIME